MKINNEFIAAKLTSLASMLDVIDAGQFTYFKKRAYLKAAAAINNFPKPITKASQLAGVPGVGPSILTKVDEILKDGDLAILHPYDDYSDLLKIQGVGPVKAKKLFNEFGVTKVSEVARLLGTNVITDPKLKQAVERALKVSDKRLPYVAARMLANMVELAIKLSAPKGIIQTAGSLRRQKSTIKDVDIIYAGNPSDIAAAKKAYMSIKWDYVSMNGETRCSAIYQGTEVDIRFVTREQYGATLLYFTGPAELNIRMRQEAIAKGLKLNEYGLWKGKRCIASKTEEEIFKALDMPYVKPEERK